MPLQVKLMVRFAIGGPIRRPRKSNRWEEQVMERLRATRSIIFRATYANCVLGSLLLAVACMLGRARPSTRPKRCMPKHITPQTLKAVRAGLGLSGPHAGRRRQLAERPKAASAYPVAMTGLAGTALLANGNTPDPRPLRAASREGRRVSARLARRATGLITGPDAGQRPADARPRLRADVSGLRLRHARPSRRCATGPSW